MSSANAAENNEKQKIHVLIAAAGSGSRMNADRPKQYCTLGGEMVLTHTLKIFLKMDEIDTITTIINPADEPLYRKAAENLEIHNFAEGSKTRNLSIYNGLKSISKVKNKDIVLIHDAARPCAAQKDIRNLIRALKTHQAASLATPVSETLFRAEGEYVERNDLYTLQTPQGFHYEIIKQAHEQADPKKTYTDDTSLVREMGIPVHLVAGSPDNIKITHPQDMTRAAQILQATYETRTGMGFDVHAFDDGKKDLILCGVKIPHERGLKGHSDADVGLHAITDALLGAMAEGDIGRHFPPSDPAFKDMDSAIFLEKARDLLNEKRAAITNIDLTLICERPKIAPHAAAMTARIAQILNIAQSRISIKATTSEKLGFTGRGEGIAAQAIATIKTLEKPDDE